MFLREMFQIDLSIFITRWANPALRKRIHSEGEREGVLVAYIRNGYFFIFRYFLFPFDLVNREHDIPRNTGRAPTNQCANVNAYISVKSCFKNP